MKDSKPRRSQRRRKTGRRNPFAALLLIAIGLSFTGGVYAAFSSMGTATANPDINSQQTIDQGERLFAANCASCHGLQAQGSDAAPALAGVGAAAVDFQVGTGRMPLQMQGPQALDKPVQFTEEEITQLAAYVASRGPGPAIPSADLANGGGNAANGAELFRINCAMCHNVAGAGGALTEGKFAPNLSQTTGTHIYEAMVTGPQNMPVFNDLNITPENKRDIITYLQYVQQNPSPGGNALGSLGPVSEGLFIWIFGLGVVVALTVWITARSN